MAVRASVTVLLALSVLAATDHLGWALYASFGAFTSVYGGRLPVPGRWRTQSVIGAVLVGAVVLGTVVATSGHRAAIVVPVAAVFAAAFAHTAIVHGWKPPGSLFPTFALGACASVPSVWSTVPTAFAVAAVTAAVTVALGAAEERCFPAPEATPPIPAPATADDAGEEAGDRVAPAVVAPPVVDPWWEALRTVLAVLVSGAIGTAVGVGHPYWAMVAAVAPLTGPVLRHRMVRGLHRAVGTAVGLVPAFVLLSLPLPLWALVLVIAVLQGGAELLVGQNYSLALMFITPLALAVGHAAHPTPVGELVAERGIETGIGVVVGMAVAYLLHVEPRARR